MRSCERAMCCPLMNWIVMYLVHMQNNFCCYSNWSCFVAKSMTTCSNISFVCCEGVKVKADGRNMFVAVRSFYIGLMGHSWRCGQLFFYIKIYFVIFSFAQLQVVPIWLLPVLFWLLWTVFGSLIMHAEDGQHMIHAFWISAAPLNGNVVSFKYDRTPFLDFLWGEEQERVIIKLQSYLLYIQVHCCFIFCFCLIHVLVVCRF